MNHKIKKPIVFFLSLTIVFQLLCGCSQTADSTASDSKNTESSANADTEEITDDAIASDLAQESEDYLYDKREIFYQIINSFLAWTESYYHAHNGQNLNGLTYREAFPILIYAMYDNEDLMEKVTHNSYFYNSTEHYPLLAEYISHYYDNNFSYSHYYSNYDSNNLFDISYDMTQAFDFYYSEHVELRFQLLSITQTETGCSVKALYYHAKDDSYSTPLFQAEYYFDLSEDYYYGTILTDMNIKFPNL